MKGFTLVEILVSVLIFGLLVGAIYAVLNIGNIVFREDINLVGLQQQVRRSMDSMVNEIRESKSSVITLADANTKITFSVPPAVYGDQWIGPISYYRDVNDSNGDGVTDQIIREYPTGTRRILANDITALSFSITGEVVEIGVAAQKTVSARQICFPSPCAEPTNMFRETVRLRNED